jgi:type I restriction enzyme S subunit
MTISSSWASLPVGWESDRLKDIVALRDEKVLVEDSTENYLELEDLEGGTGQILSRRDTLSVESAVTRFGKGDVLFGKLRPYLEKYCQPDFDGYCTGEILAFFPHRIEGRFLFYCMGADWLIQRCNALAYGAKMPRVNWPKQLALFEFPLPSLPEQKRIAAYLDASCAAIDRAVAAKQQQLDTLDALRKSIIQRAVTQGLNLEVEMKESGVDWLGSVPKHWQIESLKRATRRIQTGTTPPTSSTEYFENGSIHWFAPESFGKTITLGEPKKLIHESAVEDNKLRIFPAETVLFVGIGATIGKVAVLAGEGSANQQIVGITCDHRMSGRFLAYQLKNYEGIIPRIAQYTTLPILNQTKVGYLKVLRPPIAEQQAICDYLEAKEVEISAVEEVLQTQISTLTAYRKSLIHECVTGQRRISDADVEHVKKENPSCAEAIAHAPSETLL